MTSSASSPRTEPGRLAIVTPSRVGSAQRAAFARASLAELRGQLGDRYAHVVVDDAPMHRGRLLGVVPEALTRRIPDLAFRGAARDIYSGQRGVEFVRGGGGNSLTAVRRALARARARGCVYAFIHLDDNAYNAMLGGLIEHSITAMNALPDLNLVRLSAYPILTDACDGERGNLSLCEHAGDTVRFDSVTLRPVRLAGFTVWQAPWEATTADSRFWPVMLWNAVYRIGFLEALLGHPSVAALPGLGPVEAWYKKHWAEGWQRLAGRFGFINMQFCGLERERNPNWRELIALPNRAVL